MTIVDFTAYKQYREMLDKEEEALPILELLENLDKIDKCQAEDIYYGILEGQISFSDFKYWLKKGPHGV